MVIDQKIVLDLNIILKIDYFEYSEYSVKKKNDAITKSALNNLKCSHVVLDG